MKIKHTEYSSVEAMQEVIGSLLIEPSLLKKHKVLYTDFTKPFYMYVFLAIEHLLSEGAKDITPILIKEYLQNYTEKYASFKAQGGIETLQMLIETSNTSNFEYHYELLKKFSLLRDLKTAGIDVSEFFDPEEVDVAIATKKREKLEKTPLDDIVAHYKTIFSAISNKFIEDKSIDKKKAGVGFMEQKEHWKKETAWGVGYSSAYLTTALHGIRQRRYVVKSAGTGVGKR